MGKLEITKKVRTSGDIEIAIDGQNFGVISDDQTREFDLPAGKHILQAKLRWLGSAEAIIELDEKSVSSWIISDNINIFNFSFIYLTLIIIILGFFKENFKFYNGINIIIMIFTPLIVVNIYSLTLGRNRRMVIKKNK